MTAERIRTPRSTGAATRLLERFADVDGQIAAIDAERRVELSKVNARFDALAAPLLPLHQTLQEKLKAWWQDAGAALTQGKRKSIALGGCEIGSRMGSASLGIEGDEKAIAARLDKLRWAQELTRTTISIDRAAVMKSLDGAHAADLATMGFSRIDGVETVFIRRVQQDGTVTAVAGAGA